MGTEKRIRIYIADWEEKCYKQGIPDEAPAELEQSDLVPSYRRICKAILKNDLHLLSLGFTKGYSKQYVVLKRIELEQRNPTKQLKLNL